MNNVTIRGISVKEQNLPVMPRVADSAIDRAASIAHIFLIIHDDLTPS